MNDQFECSNLLESVFGEEWKYQTVMSFLRIHHHITIHTDPQDLSGELIEALDLLMSLANDLDSFEKR